MFHFHSSETVWVLNHHVFHCKKQLSGNLKKTYIVATIDWNNDRSSCIRLYYDKVIKARRLMRNMMAGGSVTKHGAREESRETRENTRGEG